MSTPAKSCLKALQDATGKWPARNSSGDGIMGDAAHQKRKSDHNDGNAFDLTHDPRHGVDCNVLSQQVINDRRVTYVIWNRKIYNREMAKDGWRPYTGESPHDHHMHVSIAKTSRDDLARWPWSWGTGYVPFPGTLKEKSLGPHVGALQKRLADLGYALKVDHSFGAKTKAAVIQFQTDRGLKADGVVGRTTWAVLVAGLALRANQKPRLV